MKHVNPRIDIEPIINGYKVESLLTSLGINFPTHHQRKIVERAILGLPLHRPFASESTEGALKANSVASRALFRHRLIMQKQIF